MPYFSDKQIIKFLTLYGLFNEHKVPVEQTHMFLISCQRA